ncbi:UDP-glucosyl transferase 85A2 [Cinnamomum micranthum f. kanehirae]|uniref:Glycosyltransferase n=1 Tax=Cinnamomum micranthum f. kanehirae TaxID=337451 RepID=A0A443P006_9MAGN|nr:UDP-glucosyl transferase 85A2 [Cinnamomum micranthum f. kanehirae]
MGSLKFEKPHAVCIPFPAQGHINPMFKLAKLLHFRGFHITFVHTEFNYQRLLKSRGPDSLKDLDDFRFEIIPDGLPPSDVDATQDIGALFKSTSKNCLVPFRNLVKKLNSREEMPGVSCIVADAIMTFTMQVADELCIPKVLLWTASTCSYMGYLHFPQLVERGLVPLKDESYFTNGYLDTQIDWIKGMEDIRLKDLPTFLRTTDPNDPIVNFVIQQGQRAFKASAVIINTFHELEHEVLNAMASMLPHIYSIGSLSLLVNKLPISTLNATGSNLWKEERECLEWLDTKELKSVLYVNFGSITVMSAQQMSEFAWGLANSNQNFLWVVRPDLVRGESAVLPEEFANITKERGLLVSWCPQEEVLLHPSVGGFLTHCGWNSTLESICAGVPVICWPFFADQQTNCRFACATWSIGMEIESDGKRQRIEGLVRELMEGEKGEEMRQRALEWKESAENAVKEGVGSSCMNLEKLINNVLLVNVSKSIGPVQGKEGVSFE